MPVFALGIARLSGGVADALSAGRGTPPSHLELTSVTNVDNLSIIANNDYR